MATHYGIEYKAAYVDEPRQKQDAFSGSSGAKVYFKEYTYKTSGSEAAGEKLYFGKLPAGAVLIPGLSRVFCADWGTDMDCDLGYEGSTAAKSDPDAWLDGVAFDAGANNSLLIAANTALGTPFDEEKDVVLTFVNGGAAPAVDADVEITLHLFFALQGG